MRRTFRTVAASTSSERMNQFQLDEHYPNLWRRIFNQAKQYATDELGNQLYEDEKITEDELLKDDFFTMTSKGAEGWVEGNILNIEFWFTVTDTPDGAFELQVDGKYDLSKNDLQLSNFNKVK